MCVWFSLQLLTDTFLILRRNERDVIKNFIYFHVNSPLLSSYFNETWNIAGYIRKTLQLQISWKSVQWEPSCSMWTDRRTDRQADRHDKANNSFSQFCESACKRDRMLVEMKPMVSEHLEYYRLNWKRVLES
jgi:hypothetical protein